MRSLPERLLRFFDVRQGEGRIALRGFALLLLLIITAHTILETARDALLLTGPGPRALGIVYMAIAVCALPAGAVVGRLSERIGPARALAVTLLVASIATTVMFAIPLSRLAVMALYVMTGVIASVVVPQFWVLVGTVLTMGQGRRLFGLISSGGVIGGVLGSGAAALAIARLPVKALLLVSSTVFFVSALIVALRPSIRTGALKARRRPVVQTSLRALREQPFLLRIALIVVLSTATVLSVDYLFKWNLVRVLPTAEVGAFVARYYLALNVASLVVQVFLGSAIVRRLGVATAVVVTPSLLLVALLAAVLGGGALLPVLGVKAIDGSLRYSLNRITGELIYLPVPAGVRSRAKPLIDGALVRVTQTLVGAGFLAASGAAILSPRLFATAVAVLAVGWVVVAVTTRRPYLALLRRAISTGALSTQESPDPIDLESAEILVQHLSSQDPLEVVGAMRALSRRGREGFVSALILLHHDEAVVTQALEIFGASSRTDWIALAQQLLSDPREPVRIASARALVTHGQLDAERLASDSSPRASAYGVAQLALHAAQHEVMRYPRVASLLAREDAAGEEARLGLLAAIADAPPTPRFSSLLVALSTRVAESREGTELLARAAARQGDLQVVPRLVSILSRRAGREAVRAALVSLGDAAFVAVENALHDPASPRSLRVHLPKTLARFGHARAAESLLRAVETETDRLVRYKAIRALEVLVDTHHVKVDRLRVERLSQVNLEEHFRALGLRMTLEPPGDGSPAPGSAVERLLLGLLDDKRRQSLERAFRLLKIAHPAQGIRRAYLACLSRDSYARANAVEFLDTLLRRRDQQRLRELLCLAADDLPVDERLLRASTMMREDPLKTRDGALSALVEDADVTLAALAALHALALGGPELRGAVERARRRRPDVGLSAEYPFVGASDKAEARNG